MQFLSSAVMPTLFCIILGYGLWRRVDLFDAFLTGAKAGLSTSLNILPALVGLLAAISMFRASGALSFLTGCLSPLTSLLGLPEEILPLALLRPVSGSGALAIVQDILAENGPDSPVGRIASVVMGSTETTFYTLAVYYGSASIKKSRYTVPAALSADITGILAGVFICKFFFQ